MFAAVQFSTLPQQLVNGILVGMIYALIALGYTMVYGVLKLINFAHGEVFMLGAYGALFVSWRCGFGPGGTRTESSALVLVLMLLGAMGLCAIVGIIIERFAYRPMRNQPRIASLITAIGLSLLLQYGGQVFILNGSPQTINGAVNPFQGKYTIPLKGADLAALKEADKLAPALKTVDDELEAQLKLEKSPYDLSAKGEEVKKRHDDMHRKYVDAVDAAQAGAIQIELPKGQMIMLLTTVVIMGLLTYLVMFTKVGRAMRAVSHDFSASALMGINVDRIITFTFILGSALAGAGAMMYATFLPGTKIDTFMGMAPGVKAFVAAVLGGIGNIPGAVLGGLLMGIAEILVVWAGYSNYRDAIAFVILISVLMFRPGGLMGSAKVEKV